MRKNKDDKNDLGKDKPTTFERVEQEFEELKQRLLKNNEETKRNQPGSGGTRRASTRQRSQKDSKTKGEN